MQPSSDLSDVMTETAHTRAEHKPRPLIDLAVSILIPSLILMKLSGEDRLGADGALLLALAFPLGWGFGSWPDIASSTGSHCSA